MQVHHAKHSQVGRQVGAQFGLLDDTSSALKKRCRVSKATWTGLQRGSSMSRFLLANSLVTVGSSVLPHVTRLTEKKRKEGREALSFRFPLVTSSVRRDAASSCSCFLFLSILSSRPPPHGQSHFSPFSASLLPLRHFVLLSLSLYLSRSPLFSSHNSSSLRPLPIRLSVYLSISVFLSKHRRVPRAPRAPPPS